MDAIQRALKDVLDTAIENNVANAHDVYELAVKYGTNYHAAVDAVCEWAFVNRHSPAGVAVHAEIVRAAEGFWRAESAAA